MNALLVAREFLPASSGGISDYYYQLCHRLDGDLSVLAPASGGDAAFDALQPFEIHRRRTATRWLGCYRAGRRIVEERGLDTVLIGHLRLAPVGPALRRATGARHGMILHGGELHRHTGRWPAWRLIRRALDSADFLVTDSSHTRRRYVELGVRGDGRWLRLHPGVDTALFRPEAGDPDGVRRRYGLDDRPIVASLARLEPWSGQDSVLRALPAVLERVPDVAYLVVGDGPCRKDLADLAGRSGLRDRVVMAGRVRDEELPSYYRAADVVALPSRGMASGAPIEGFATAHVEAAACGVPVVGGPGGGADESIEHGVTGFRVDPERPDALADALVRLLSDPDLARRFGRAGRERAIALFDWERQVLRLREFLDGTATSRGVVGVGA